MSQPILSLEATQAQQDSQAKARVNLVPARIAHDGEVGAIDQFWNPVMSQDNTQNIAYFRGRKLYGKTVTLPKGYYGAVASKQDPSTETSNHPEEDADRAAAMDLDDADRRDSSDAAVPIQNMCNEGTFDDFIVWGHESVADAGQDAYVRGIEEWIGFAEKIHGHSAADTAR